MSLESQLVVGWLLFGGTHIGLSSRPIRGRLTRALGLRAFKGLYSLVALATLTWLAGTWWTHRHAGLWFFAPPPWTRHATEILMLPAILLLVLAFATPNPSTTQAEMSGRFAASARGIHRVTRHPMNAGFALFGAAHMIRNPSAGDWIFWGGFVVFWIAGSVHQDRRMLRTGPSEFRAFHEETSLLPFAAILAGRQRFVPGEIRRGAVVLAVALWVGIRLAHPHLFGGFAS